MSRVKPGIDRERIDPQFLTELGAPVERVYELIEHDMLVNMAGMFNAGRRGESGERFDYDARHLAMIGRLSRENFAAIERYAGIADEERRLALETAAYSAVAAVDPELALAAQRPDYVPAPSETAERITGAYTSQAANRYNLVNTVMLNSSLANYRRTVSAASADYEKQLARAQATLNAEAGAVALGTKSRTEAVYSAVARMADAGLTGFIDASGREWTAQAYAQMDIRTTAANVAREAVGARNDAYGNNLIMVSSHVGARPLCAPYQGRVYSTDGTSGAAHDAVDAEIPYIPLTATSYGQPAGLFGINCGHMQYPFVDGVSMQSHVPFANGENKRIYELSQQQRYMERKIRKLGTIGDALDAAGDTEGAAREYERARRLKGDLKNWCKENDMPYRRDRVTQINAHTIAADRRGLKTARDEAREAAEPKIGIPNESTQL